MRASLRTKLILAIGAPLLLVYLLMLWILLDQIQSRGIRQLQRNAQEAASGTAARIGSRLSLAARSADDLATVASKLPARADFDIEAAAQAVADRDPLIYRIMVVLPPDATMPRTRVKGSAQTGDGASPPIDSLPPPSSQDPASSHLWMDGPLASGKSVWSEPFQDPANGGPRVAAYATPIRWEKEIVGVVRVDFLLETLGRKLGPLPLAEGEFTLVSREGRVLFFPAGAHQESDQLSSLLAAHNRADLAEGVKRVLNGETGMAEAEGLLQPGRRWYAFAPIPSTDWFFIESVPESVILAFSRSQQQLGIAILAGGLVLILSLVALMATRITRPLATLASGVEKLGAGDLDTQVTGIESKDEIGALAAAFNRMVADLKKHVEALARETAAREKVEGEIRVARQIQTALLPRKLPRGEGFELQAVNLPARRVAGDFYDSFLREDGTLVFLIADVSGKGVPAALFMAVARTVLRDVLSSGDSLAAAVERANNMLEKDSPGSMYVTLFVALYEIATGKLRYVNGGHPAPYRLDPRGGVSPFGEVSGPMVGLLRDRKYEEGSGSLEPGDRLVLFTDGVPEASDPRGEFFGEERFQALLAEAKEDSCEAVCRRISERVEAYQQGTRYDDLTLVVLGRKEGSGVQPPAGETST